MRIRNTVSSRTAKPKILQLKFPLFLGVAELDQNTKITFLEDVLHVHDGLVLLVVSLLPVVDEELVVDKEEDDSPQAREDSAQQNLQPSLHLCNGIFQNKCRYHGARGVTIDFSRVLKICNIQIRVGRAQDCLKL